MNGKEDVIFKKIKIYDSRSIIDSFFNSGTFRFNLDMFNNGNESNNKTIVLKKYLEYLDYKEDVLKNTIKSLNIVNFIENSNFSDQIKNSIKEIKLSIISKDDTNKIILLNNELNKILEDKKNYSQTITNTDNLYTDKKCVFMQVNPNINFNIVYSEKNINDYNVLDYNSNIIVVENFNKSFFSKYVFGKIISNIQSCFCQIKVKKIKLMMFGGNDPLSFNKFNVIKNALDNVSFRSCIDKICNFDNIIKVKIKMNTIDSYPVFDFSNNFLSELYALYEFLNLFNPNNNNINDPFIIKISEIYNLNNNDLVKILESYKYNLNKMYYEIVTRSTYYNADSKSFIVDCNKKDIFIGELFTIFINIFTREYPTLISLLNDSIVDMIKSFEKLIYYMYLELILDLNKKTGLGMAEGNI